MDNKRYLTERKKGLKELAVLEIRKAKINAEIAVVRKDLRAWDRALVNEE